MSESELSSIAVHQPSEKPGQHQLLPPPDLALQPADDHIMRSEAEQAEQHGRVVQDDAAVSSDAAPQSAASSAPSQAAIVTDPTAPSTVGNAGLLPAGPPSNPSPRHLTNVDLTKREILAVFGVLMTGVVLVGLDASIVGTAGPTIVRDLGNFSLFPWIVSAYFLASAAVVPIYGKVSDIVGRHAVFQFAIFCFALGSLIAALATSMVMLIIARAIQGMGGSGLIVMAQTTIGDMLAPAERGRYQGILSSVIAVSAIAGPVVGGLFTTYWTWRGIFWLNLPFCGLSAAMIFLKLRQLTIRARHVSSVRDVDWLGSLLVVAATVSLIMPLVWGGSTYAWNAGQIIGLLVAFGVLTVVFVLSERWWGLRANLPLHMFKVRNFSLCILIRFFSGAVLYGLVSYLPSYWQTVQDESATISGLRTAPVLFCATVGSVAAGQSIARTTKWKPVPVVGTGLQVLGIGLLTTIAVDSSYVKLAFYMIFAGLGYGLTGPSASIVVQSSVPLADLAAASAGGTFFNQLGGAVGVAVTGAVFNNLYEQRVTQLYGQQGLGPVPADPIDLSGSQLGALTPAQQAAFFSSYVYALDRALYVVLAFAACQFVFTCALKDVPLRGRAKKPQPDATAPEKPTAAAEAAADREQQPRTADAAAASSQPVVVWMSETKEAVADGRQVKAAPGF